MTGITVQRMVTPEKHVFLCNAFCADGSPKWLRREISSKSLQPILHNSHPAPQSLIVKGKRLVGFHPLRPVRLATFVHCP